MEDAMDKIPGRVNDLEKESHTLEHRVKNLEGLPVKVSDLERSFGIMDANLMYIKQTGIETKRAVDRVNDSQKTLIGELKGVPRAVNLVAGLVAIGGIGVSIVMFFS